MAPESCSDEVAVVLLINAAAGTAPFVRNLPILVLQFEPEVSTGTELQGKVPLPFKMGFVNVRSMS